MKKMPTASHWGAYRAIKDTNGSLSISPAPFDREPSLIGRSLPESINHATRITAPMVRSGWLKNGPGGISTNDRGKDTYIEISWDNAIQLLTDELLRVKEKYGNKSIYAGSYGWASAGRFHHAQSQMRRFLNLFGGHSYSVNTYSYAAAEVILPHVTGSFSDTYNTPTTWENISKNSDLVVSFGGFALKNSQVAGGGIGSHIAKSEQFKCLKSAHVKCIYLSPNKSDVENQLQAEWIAIRPNTDTAIMLGIAHTLYINNWHKKDFLEKYCYGFERFAQYLTGNNDGIAKNADWAAKITGISADKIRLLAKRIVRGRTIITASWSLQRAEYGEQPYWALVTLAAMIGQIGLPGGGFGIGYAATGNTGAFRANPLSAKALPVSPNPVDTFIPVARIADMLLSPGEKFNYNGMRLTYPDTKMVYWCGGNPFHHHQDINKLLLAWRRPETIVIHDSWWTSTARHSDIVLPCSTSLERNDFTASSSDPYLLAMHKISTPYAKSRNEYDIYTDLSDSLGFRSSFTEDRSEMEWIEWMYNQTINPAKTMNIEAPAFQDFWEQGYWKRPLSSTDGVYLNKFREAPQQNPLRTPSGKIELYSEKIASFGYRDCPPHAAWLEPKEWLGAKITDLYPLHLISNQPKDKLHSQLDFGINSRQNKVKGRAPILIHPKDASARNINSGDIVRVYNERGSCLAGAVVTEDVMQKVVILPTGAWYDPEEPGQVGSLDVHGNPNVLTHDTGTSSLAQGPSAQSCLVQISRFDDFPPTIKVFDPPHIISSESAN